jgi:lysophospholipase L1-like esterase
MKYSTPPSISLFSQFKKTLIVLAIVLTISNIMLSQCLTVGDIGDFEASALSDDWWSNTQGNGVISTDITTAYTGSKSVKVDVTTASTWQVRMYNVGCDFNITSGNSYRVTLYAKGEIGNSIDVSLLDNATTEAIGNVILTSSGWQKYQVMLTSGVTSTNGKIRLSFREVGTYYIDNISYQHLTMTSASISDPNICWEGVMESEITGDGQLRNFRFLKSYATNNVANYYTAERASSSAGIIMKIKTSSPSINLSFSEDLTWAADVFNHKISIYKDNVYQSSTNDFDISLSNSSGITTEWKLVMPTYSQMNFKSIDIENGYTIESVSCNSKPVYVAIGNSITMGVGLSNNDSKDAYSRYIADSLGYELYNWGIGGSKVHDTVYTNLRNSSLKPDLITVLWGFNDVHFSKDDNHFTASTFPKYENLLTSILQNYPTACVMAILPTFTNNPENTTTRTIDNLEAGQLNIINSLQLTYPNLDYMQGTSYSNALSLADDVHLNNDGNITLAKGIISELNCGTMTSKVEADLDNKFKVYPNPTDGIINLEQAQHYIVLDLSGRLLQESFGKIVDLNQLQKGVYLLKASSRIHKIIKR